MTGVQHGLAHKRPVEVGKGMFELQTSSTSQMRERMTLCGLPYKGPMTKRNP